MNNFANEKDNNNNVEVKKNMEQSLENANKSNSNLSLENEYNIKPIIEQIIAKGIKEWHPKHPLNSTLVPNNVNQIINQKNKFDSNSVRSFSLQKIVQHKSTNRTNSNINYPKFDIKADPFFPKDIIKNNFNIVVSEAIKNHETEPLFKVDGNDLVDDKSFTFDEATQTKLTINKVIDKLWKSYIEKKNIKIGDTEIFELSLSSTKCILSDENKNELIKLFDDAKRKVLDEQEKNLEKEIIEKEEKIKKEKQENIKQKLSEQVDVLINDIYKFENNYIVCGEDAERCHDKNHLNGEYTNSRTCRATSMLIKEKLINSFLNSEDKSVITNEELKKIVNEVVESKKNKIEEKIASDIENRKQVLKDFNDFVSREIDKHSYERVMYQYDYEKQKFFLPPNEFYDTADDLETALIKIYAQRYSEHKNTEKPYNSFDSNPYSLNVDSIEVLDDITKRKLGDSISALFKNRIDELSKIFNNSGDGTKTDQGNRASDDIRKIINHLTDSNLSVISDGYLNMLKSILSLYVRIESSNDVAEILYNVIYNMIKNSKDYKDNYFNREYQRQAIREFFDPNGFYKKFWIMLAELSDNDNPSYKFSASEILTMEKINTLYLQYYDYKNPRYCQQLYDLLLEYDIYIAPTTEKTKDNNDKEVNQIHIKVDSYKACKEFAVRQFGYFLDEVIANLEDPSIASAVQYDWVQGELTYKKETTYCFRNVNFCSNEIDRLTNWFADRIIYLYLENKKLLHYRNFFPKTKDFVINIQKIVGEKQQTMLKELIDGFSEFVDEKIENHNKQKELLFVIKEGSICNYKYNAQKLYDFGMVNDLANEIVEQFITEYFRNKFYINDNTKRLIQKEIEEQENKLKTLSNNAIKEHIKNNKLNYEYNEKDESWEKIPEKNIEEKVKQQANPENKKLNDVKKESVINLNQKSKIENKDENEQDNKIKEEITEENIDEKDLEAYINTVLRNAKESLGLENKFDAFLKNIIDELEKMPNLIKVDWVNGTIQCDKIGKEKIVINKDGNLDLLAISICESLKYKFLFKNNISIEQIQSFNHLKFGDNRARLKKILENMQNSKMNSLKIKQNFIENIKSRIGIHKDNLYTIESTDVISMPDGFSNDSSKRYFTNVDEAAFFWLTKELNEYCKGKFYTINIFDQKTLNELKSMLKKTLEDGINIKKYVENNKNNDMQKNESEIRINNKINTKQKKGKIHEATENIDHERQKDKQIEYNTTMEVKNKIKIDKKSDEHDLTDNKIDNENVNYDLENKSEVDENQQKNIDSSKTEKENKENKDKPKENDILGPNGINIDENKNQNEIEIKNMEKNNENGTKNDTSEELSDKDKIVEDNDKIDKNRIKENLDKSKAQTLDSADKNNRNQSETKNEGLIKFLAVLKWIALIGFILTLAMTVLSIFIASLSAAIVKFVIAAVVLFFVFVMSKLLVSCLSNKQPKENKNPYPDQIDTGIETKENQNEFNINNLVNNESNINQIAEQEKNNSSFIGDRTDN